MASKHPATHTSSGAAAERRPVRDFPQVKALRLLFRAYTQVADDHERHIKGTHDLLLTEFDMLGALGNTDGLRMGELAAALITSPGNVTRVAQTLEKRGLVQRARSPKSDREVLARLTPEGETFFRKHFMDVVGFTAAYMDSRLSTAEQRHLSDLLAKLLVQK